MGIVGYGTSLPRWAVDLEEIGLANRDDGKLIGRSLKVTQKTVPDLDEDTVTFATSAAITALNRALGNGLQRQEIQALFIGSESHPYAVKPSGTMVAQALGLRAPLAMADLQFACKAGTQAMQVCASLVLSGLAQAGLAIGADTAQANPGDMLEYTASAGAAAYLIGKKRLLARLLATTSVASDTPDFWRRAGEKYPQHGGRFTGKPAYFDHVKQAARLILSELNLEPSNLDFCIFHTPNGKFPREMAKQLGFSISQLQDSLVVEQIGNSYAAAVPLALAAVLDKVSAHAKILMVSYGSGAGADAFVWQTTPALITQRKKWEGTLLSDQISLLKKIDLPNYVHFRNDRTH